MMNLAACHSKTTPAPTPAPRYEKSRTDKGLMQGRSPRHHLARETSRYTPDLVPPCIHVGTGTGLMTLILEIR